jgi:Co/Zn/Cd efflux system component
MIGNRAKLYREQLRLTLWFALITAVCTALALVSYYWIHSMLLLVIGVMFGPIFALLAVAFGAIALANRLSPRK